MNLCYKKESHDHRPQLRIIFIDHAQWNSWEKKYSPFQMMAHIETLKKMCGLDEQWHLYGIKSTHASTEQSLYLSEDRRKEDVEEAVSGFESFSQETTMSCTPNCDDSIDRKHIPQASPLSLCRAESTTFDSFGSCEATVAASPKSSKHHFRQFRHAQHVQQEDAIIVHEDPPSPQASATSDIIVVDEGTEELPFFDELCDAFGDNDFPDPPEVLEASGGVKRPCGSDEKVRFTKRVRYQKSELSVAEALQLYTEERKKSDEKKYELYAERNVLMSRLIDELAKVNRGTDGTQ